MAAASPGPEGRERPEPGGERGALRGLVQEGGGARGGAQEQPGMLGETDKARAELEAAAKVRTRPHPAALDAKACRHLPASPTTSCVTLNRPAAATCRSVGAG